MVGWLVGWLLNKQDVVSLLAYPDPNTSPVSALLREAYRETLASTINGAVMGMSEQH
jgi:hypothetical protein